jgi:signal transduction histidine kinase
MAQRSVMLNFLLGNKSFELKSVYKRAVLLSQLGLLSMGVGIVYIFVDIANRLYVNIPYYLALIVVSLIVLALNRAGRHQAANIIYLLSVVTLISFFAINDINHTGVHTYFILFAIIALILCGYENLKTGIFFCVVAVALFFVAYWVNPPNVIPRASYSEKYIDIAFAINFGVPIVITVSLLYFILEINFKSEKQLSINNQLLSKTNQELDRFVYSASHDLRAPLSSLLGLIELAQLSEDPEEIKHCLKLMRNSVSDLDGFIREIIDYSRNTRIEIKNEKFNLLELVQEVSDGLKFGSGLENLFIKYDIPSALEVTTDRLRLKTILYNLIGNAFKYHDSLKPEQLVSISAQTENQALKIAIEDNGIGIAAEHVPRIFEMFYRASEKSQGSGLGLYIVKETLNKLNGKIEVISSPQTGSRFTVEIPFPASGQNPVAE